MNKAFLIGRLTKDPDLRFTPSNAIPVTSFTLAVDRPFLNRQGEREADFIRVVAWRKLAEIYANNLQKGRLVAVFGRIQVRNYKTQDGQRRTISEVVADEVKFLDWPKEQKGKQEISDYDDSVFNPEAFEQTEEVPF